jgi:hypothetical protein
MKHPIASSDSSLRGGAAQKRRVRGPFQVAASTGFWKRILKRYRWTRSLVRPRVPLHLLRYRRAEHAGREGVNVTQYLSQYQLALNLNVSWLGRERETGGSLPNPRLVGSGADALLPRASLIATQRAVPIYSAPFRSVSLTESALLRMAGATILRQIRSESSQRPAAMPDPARIARAAAGLSATPRHMRAGQSSSGEALPATLFQHATDPHPVLPDGRRVERTVRSEDAWSTSAHIRPERPLSLATRRMFAATLLETRRRFFAECLNAYRTPEQRRASTGVHWTHNTPARPANAVEPAYRLNKIEALTHAAPTARSTAGNTAPAGVQVTVPVTALPRIATSFTFARQLPAGATERPPSTDRVSEPPARSYAPPVPAPIDVARLSEEVYRHIQRKIRIDRERRGISG